MNKPDSSFQYRELLSNIETELDLNHSSKDRFTLLSARLEIRMVLVHGSMENV